MSKLFTRASVTGTSLTGANLKATLTALWDALNTGGFSDASRSTVTTTSTLLTTQCGLLLVDASAGSITLTLPTSGAATDDAGYILRRIDSSANTVTVQRGGTDTIEGQTSIALPPCSVTDLQMPGGAANWRYIGAAGNAPVLTTGGTSTAYTITPIPASTAYSANQQFFLIFHVASGASPTLQISGVATPPNLVKQNADGTYSNIAASEIPINHRSRVTLLSATQALVEKLPQFFGYRQTYTSNGTFTVPAGVTTIYVSATAGGGAGGTGASGTSGCGSGGGGGGAGQSINRLGYAVTPGQSIAITIGAAGGNTIVGSLVTLTAGSAGGGGANINGTSAGGAGGAGYPIGSAAPDVSNNVPGGTGGAGASGPFGGGGGCGRNGSSAGTAGAAAFGYGAGGGGGGGYYIAGAGTGAAGGAGAAGFVAIEY